MLTPNITAVILLAASILLLVIIPLVDGSERFRQYISLRYTLVAIAAIMAMGCILDFSHLAESSRNIVLAGALGLTAVFVAVRSLEKVKLGNKQIEVSAKKGDIEVSAKLQNKESEQNNNCTDEKTNGKHIVNESSTPSDDNKNSTKAANRQAATRKAANRKGSHPEGSQPTFTFLFSFVHDVHELRKVILIFRKPWTIN